MESTQTLIKKFEEKPCEIIFEWKDNATGAEGWLVINSLRGGAAGGGTRMRKGLDKLEVVSLAKTMEVKFAVSGPAIGGAKSGINFDPFDPRKGEVLDRWYKALMPILKTYYGTGGDLNIDEIHEVIPITENYGLWHPQEGIVNGHFGKKESDKIKRIGQLRFGVSKIIEDTEYSPDVKMRYRVADMITGYGVAESVGHFLHLKNDNLAGKKVIIQGWGNVGSAAAYYLSKQGAKIVGIIDRTGGVINQEGFSFAEIEKLFISKKGNELVSEKMIPFDEINHKIWTLGAEIFLPCAASRLVTTENLEKMIQHGLQIISCGANVPFADKEIFYGPVAQYADQKISVIPDFAANCGMARVFAYLMSENNVEISDAAIFKDTSKTILQFLEKVHAINPSKTKITDSAYQIALKNLL